MCLQKIHRAAGKNPGTDGFGSGQFMVGLLSYQLLIIITHTNADPREVAGVEETSPMCI